MGKPVFKEFVKNNQVFYDGAMGTMLQKQLPNLDYPEVQQGCVDSLYLYKPEVIADVHKAYYRAGAHVVETNTFGSNLFKLKEYHLEDRIDEINRVAVEVGLQSADEIYNETGIPRYVALSVGPTGFLISSDEESLNQVTYEEIFEAYYTQMEPAAKAGVDIILIETGQDLLEVKIALQAAIKVKKDLNNEDLFIQVQVTLDQYGKMLLGSSVEAVVAALSPFQIDALGINCSTGPKEMEATLQYLNHHSPFYISCLPNAGMPENIEGKAVYALKPDNFGHIFGSLVVEYQIDIAGGCCGTTPDHIARLSEHVSSKKNDKRIKKPCKTQVLSSALNAQEIDLWKKPFIIGERLNAQGSRKTRTLLTNYKFAELLEMGRQQKEQGAELLDLCTANNIIGKECELMRTMCRKINANLDIPIVPDTTDPEIIKDFLHYNVGRCLINSINLEKGTDTPTKVLKMASENGAMVIALTIDESGMAKTIDQKITVAERIIELARQCEFPLENLVFDLLVFTLGTGEDEYKDSAIQTLEAIKKLKAKYPQVHTSLGVSNVSFGLKPASRRILNNAFLDEAVKWGLDFAIFNPAGRYKKEDLPQDLYQMAVDLVYNRGEDPLTPFIQAFEDNEELLKKSISESKEETPEEKLASSIIERRQANLSEIIESCLKTNTPINLINHHLLPAMQLVGDKMATGEIILPYVLQSAKILKQALELITKEIPTESIESKGRILLATVYGDVHDIGKNLVKTILANNGFEVKDLGKQVDNELILETAKTWKPNAIGLSALLITTAREMACCVELFHKEGLDIPIFIGGAAVNEAYAEQISQIENEKYKGGVYYSKDAFQCIKILQNLIR